MFQNLNKVVRTLVIVDFFTNSAFGSFAPLLAIFITKQISNGNAAVVGFAVAAYWVTKSVFQLPIARFLDKVNGERMAFWAVFFGYFFSGFVPLAYLFVKTPGELYAVQAFYGFFMAWAVPAWYGLFTRHVDKWRISFEWSLESVFSVGLANAGAAALGGYLVQRFGFDVIFFAAGFVSITISLLILTVKKDLLLHDHEQNVLPERQNFKR